MKPFDILVVGAGIVGSAVARECALLGWRVGVIEGAVPAGGATAAGMGHVVVMDDSPAQLALTAFSRSLWQAESEKLPHSVEYESRGTLWVAADDEEMAEVHSKQATYTRAGVKAEVLNAGGLAKAEPNLRHGLAGALLVPGDGVVYPPAAAGFYLSEARRLGAELFLNRAVSASHGRVILNDGVTLSSERIVLAVGAECDLLPSMPIQKRKGHLIITDRYPGFLHHQLVELGYLKSAHTLIEDSVAFNIQPRQTGQLLIGSSRQYGNEDSAVDAEILRRMMDRAREYMPGLEKLSALRVWTGFRAATDDKLPLIGPAAELADDPSLWLAAGFEGLGITNAPGAARLLVDGMLDRKSEIDAKPFLPARLMEPARLAHA
ncbi:MAG TPA: FAD-dependent oxidoreductase [Acidobacteriaceae bacterium]|jgi:glycine/D-amino acid oxidase-like deaminating enzyme